jgi:hypothetical protein
MHIQIRRQVDDLDQFGSGELTDPASSKILQDCRDIPVNSICDMTFVQTHVLGVTYADVDFSYPAPAFRTHNVEDVKRHRAFTGSAG